MEDRNINDLYDTPGNDNFFSNLVDCKEQNVSDYNSGNIMEWLLGIADIMK